MPADAAIWRSMQVAWSDQHELLATNIEVVDALRRAFIVANSKQGTRQPEPVRIPRPWERAARQARRGTALTEMIQTMKMPVRHSGRGETHGA